MSLLKNMKYVVGALLLSSSVLVFASELKCPSDTVHISIDDRNTNNHNINDIYFIAKGLQVINGTPNGKHCYVSFDPRTQIGHCVEATNESKPENFSYKVSDFPNGICMPLVESGRIYFSINYPLDNVRVVKTEQGEPSIVDPDPFNPKDQDYYKLWDKIEFTYIKLHGKNTIWTNPTAVDFFSLPIRLELDKDVYPENFSGFSLARSTIFKDVHEAFDKFKDLKSGQAWNALFLYAPQGNDDNHILRLIAPGKGILPNVQASDHTFDPIYLSNNAYGFNYIDRVWEYYEKHKVTVDVSELFPPNPQGSNIITGQVENNLFVFKCAKGCNEKNIKLNVQFTKPVILKTGQGEGPGISLDPKNYEPGSRPFFAGAGFRDEKASLEDFDSKPNTKMIGPIIQRAITSAFDAGLLPAPSILSIGLPNDASESLKKYFHDYKKAWSKEDENKYGVLINKDYFEFARNLKPSLYYKNHELNRTYPGQEEKGPWFDLYSEALHGIGAKHNLNEPIYTFAYDDALGQDGTLSLPNPKQLVVTIGDMSGTFIPKLDVNEGSYNFLFRMAKIGSGKSAKYPTLFYCDQITNNKECVTWNPLTIPEDGIVQFKSNSPLLVKDNVEEGKDRILEISAHYKIVKPISEKTNDLAGAVNIKNCLNETKCVELEFPAF